MTRGRFRIACFGLSMLCAASVHAQQAVDTDPVELTAESVNVSGSGSAVRISIIRWSTEEERNQLVQALDPSRPPQLPVPAGEDAGGRGGGRGGRGGPATPPSAFELRTAALSGASTLGYVFTEESVVGYAIKYAYRDSLPAGGDRIVVATNRRLDSDTTAWAAVEPAASTDYPYTLIEVRLDSSGRGEGKTSLTSAVAFDGEAGTMFLDDYDAAPAMLEPVRRR